MNQIALQPNRGAAGLPTPGAISRQTMRQHDTGLFCVSADSTIPVGCSPAGDESRSKELYSPRRQGLLEEEVLPVIRLMPQTVHTKSVYQKNARMSIAKRILLVAQYYVKLTGLCSSLDNPESRLCARKQVDTPRCIQELSTSRRWWYLTT